MLSRLIRAIRRRRDEELLDAELRHHIDMETEDFVRQGLTRSEARRRARMAFGSLEAFKEAAREVRRPLSVEGWLRDGRHGVRALLRTPGFSIVVLLVLGVGTAALTAVFVLLNAVVLRPLPFRDAGRLVAITHDATGIGRRDVGVSSGVYFHYQQHARSLESIAFYDERVRYLRTEGSVPEQVRTLIAGVDLVRTLDVRPAVGRLFTAEDGALGFMDARWTIPIVLTHDFWRDRFGGSPDVVGRIVTLSDRPRRIIGVIEEGFRFPDQGIKIWELFEIPTRSASFARSFGERAVGRMRRGLTAGAVRTDLAEILPGIEGAYPDATRQRIEEVGLRPIVTPLKSALVGDVASVLWTLFGGMSCLFAVAVANAVSLFLVRAGRRQREIAVRQALGAGRGQLARLFFLEAAALTAAAAMGGLGLARVLLVVVAALSPVELPRAEEIRFDGVAVAFAASIALVMAVLYAVLAIRRDRSLIGALRADGRTMSSAGGWRVMGQASPLTVIQVALALTLLTGSALMVRTYQNLSNRSLGFVSGGLLAMEVNLSARQAREHPRIYASLVDRVSHLPGVTSAAIASFAPLTGTDFMYPVEAGSKPIPFKFFTPGYFQTVGTGVVEGGRFAPGDVVTAPFPVLVSASLARRLFPDRTAIGQPIRRLREDGSVDSMGGGLLPPFTIVGIVDAVREISLRDEPTEIVYIPIVEPVVEQSFNPINVNLIVRTGGSPNDLVESLRAAIGQTSPALSVGRVRTMNDVVRAAYARETFVGVLLLLAAVTSLFLGVVGIYGSVAHIVRTRTHEIGIRLALGARGREVVWMVATGSLRATLVGAILGVAIALASARALSSLLFGVAPGDPAIYVSVTAVLLGTAAAAAFLAARRAARISPIVALRTD